MNWIRLQSEYFRHRKTLRLTRRMGEVAALYPIKLWTWAVEQSPGGSLHDIDAEELAMICEFTGDPEKLWSAMVDCGFVETVDGERRIRSWNDHQGLLAARAERNAERMRRARSAHKPAECEATDETDETDETDGRNETDERTEAEAAPTSPVLLTFPTEGKVRTWSLTEAHVAEWSPLYPKLDVVDECRQALAWVLADASRKKTARGMKSFLVGWFGRSVNRGSRSAGGAPTCFHCGGKGEVTIPDPAGSCAVYNPETGQSERPTLTQPCPRCAGRKAA